MYPLGFYQMFYLLSVFSKTQTAPMLFPRFFFCQEWGWEVFQSIEKYCRTAYGYGSLKNVNSPNSVEDRMESFFMAGECVRSRSLFRVPV